MSDLVIGDIRTVLSWLPARERWRWFLLVPVAGLAALIEAAGALAVFGLLRLVVDPEQVRTAPVVSRSGARGPTTIRDGIVAVLALGVGVFYVLRAAFLSWADWLRQGMVYRLGGVGRRAAARALSRRRLSVSRQAPIGVADRADDARRPTLPTSSSPDRRSTSSPRW